MDCNNAKILSNLEKPFENLPTFQRTIDLMVRIAIRTVIVMKPVPLKFIELVFGKFVCIFALEILYPYLNLW